MLPRLHEAEVLGVGFKSRQVVDAQRGAHHEISAAWSAEVESFVGVLHALALEGEDEAGDGVVEVQLCAQRGVGGGGAVGLVLGDELLEGAGAECVALLHVEVDVGEQEVGADVLWTDGGASVAVDDGDVGIGHLDERLQTGEADGHLQCVELQGGDGEGVTRMLGEPEWDGNVQSAVVLGVFDQLLAGEALADHLVGLEARAVGDFGPHFHEVAVHGIHHLAADLEADAVHEGVADRVDPVCVGALEATALVEGVVQEIIKQFDIFVVVRAAVVAIGGDLAIAARVAVYGDDWKSTGVVAQRRSARGGDLTADGGDVHYEVNPIQQVRCLGQCGHDFRAERGRAVECHGGCVHGEVRASFHARPPERHIWVRSEPGIR